VPGGDEFGRGYGLAHMPLGMLGQVDKQTANCSRLPAPADFSAFAEASGIEGANSFDAFLEGRAKFRKELVFGGTVLELTLQRGDLSFFKLPSFGIGEQAIHAASDVADMKRERRDSGRTGIELSITQAAAPALDILLRQLQGMEHRSWHGGDIGQRSAQPGLLGLILVHCMASLW
jgi:hypothetical protein